MKVIDIVKDKQPEIYAKLKKSNKRKWKKESLSFSDIEKMMQHSSYKRCNGAVRQTRWNR